MKASQLLTLALAQYEKKTFAYMCHEINDISDKTKGCYVAADFLSNKIYNILSEHRTIVLHNVLRFTSKKYEGYNKRYGNNCKACLKMRIAFWQAMIVELENEGN